MPLEDLVLLCVIFLLTSIVGVVTGSNSLITVPVLFSFGVAPRVAVATNMLALVFLSLGGAIPFLRQPLAGDRRLPGLIGLTLLGSLLGAALLLVIPARSLPFLVSICMLLMVVFSLLSPKTRANAATIPPSAGLSLLGYVLTFLLAVYGGMYSGGYVTMLTATYVACFRMGFLEAVGLTKIINIFSSLIATLFFMQQGLVDYQLGIVLGVTMFFGGILGAKIAQRMPEEWLRKLFIGVVIVLALKLLLLDI